MVGVSKLPICCGEVSGIGRRGDMVRHRIRVAQIIVVAPGAYFSTGMILARAGHNPELAHVSTSHVERSDLTSGGLTFKRLHYQRTG